MFSFPPARKARYSSYCLQFNGPDFHILFHHTGSPFFQLHTRSSSLFHLSIPQASLLLPHLIPPVLPHTTAFLHASASTTFPYTTSTSSLNPFNTTYVVLHTQSLHLYCHCTLPHHIHTSSIALKYILPQTTYSTSITYQHFLSPFLTFIFTQIFPILPLFSLSPPFLLRFSTSPPTPPDPSHFTSVILSSPPFLPISSLPHCPSLHLSHTFPLHLTPFLPFRHSPQIDHPRHTFQPCQFLYVDPPATLSTTRLSQTCTAPLTFYHTFINHPDAGHLHPPYSPLSSTSRSATTHPAILPAIQSSPHFLSTHLQFYMDPFSPTSFAFPPTPPSPPSPLHHHHYIITTRPSHHCSHTSYPLSTTQQHLFLLPAPSLYTPPLLLPFQPLIVNTSHIKTHPP